MFLIPGFSCSLFLFSNFLPSLVIVAFSWLLILLVHFSLFLLVYDLVFDPKTSITLWSWTSSACFCQPVPWLPSSACGRPLLPAYVIWMEILGKIEFIVPYFLSNFKCYTSKQRIQVLRRSLKLSSAGNDFSTGNDIERVIHTAAKITCCGLYLLLTYISLLWPAVLWIYSDPLILHTACPKCLCPEWCQDIFKFKNVLHLADKRKYATWSPLIKNAL